MSETPPPKPAERPGPTRPEPFDKLRTGSVEASGFPRPEPLDKLRTGSVEGLEFPRPELVEGPEFPRPEPDEGPIAKPDPPRRTNTGAGRALVAVYGVFALAATARAAVQIATRFSEAPLAYLLSALAAAVYIVATIMLARGTLKARRIALVAVIIELVGVLTVGTLSLLDPAAFPRATVWSIYGIGYGFVPLVLPVLGLIWLYRTRPAGS